MGCVRTTLLKGCMTPVQDRAWLPSMSRTRLLAAAAATAAGVGAWAGASARRLLAVLNAARKLAGSGSA